MLLRPEPVSRDDLNNYILQRAERQREAGCDGFIASGDSVGMLRQRFADALIVVPGIRPASESADDHKRALTPSIAVESGADYLVVGRPVYQSADPRRAAVQILDEIDGALAAQA
jgi:orotidine-5'-phosphate decarboxylase